MVARLLSRWIPASFYEDKDVLLAPIIKSKLLQVKCNLKKYTTRCATVAMNKETTDVENL